MSQFRVPFSLRGLQIGEKICINCVGTIRRENVYGNIGSWNKRLDATPLLSTHHNDPAYIAYLAYLLNQILEAMGEPFRLDYSSVTCEKVSAKVLETIGRILERTMAMMEENETKKPDEQEDDDTAEEQGFDSMVIPDDTGIIDAYFQVVQKS